MKCCELMAGMLRHKVEIQAQQTIADGGGGSSLGWGVLEANVGGYLKPLSARERMQADRREHNVSHVFYCRYRSTFKPEHRLIYNGRVMQITGVINMEERSRWLELLLTEGMVT